MAMLGGFWSDKTNNLIYSVFRVQIRFCYLGT